MKKIEEKEFKVLSVKILQFIDETFKKNNIFYLLSSGTVLGAVRHNGFIPWDDDIDIYIFRKDVERVIKLFGEMQNNRYKLHYLQKKKYSLPLMKVIDDNTIIYQKGRKNEYQLGIWVDIFILDNLPNDFKKKKKLCKKLALYQYFWAFSEYKRNKLSGFKQFVKNVVLSVVTFLGSRFWAKKLDKLAQKYIKCDCDYVSSLTFTGYNITREAASFPKKMLEDVVLHKFEDNEYPIPREYDKYLTILYGDWRELPPIEKRISRHSIEAFYRE